MPNLSSELVRLSQEDPDVASVLEAYRQMESVYHDALKAMGLSNKFSAEVKNSAEVTISFDPTLLSSDQAQ